MPGPKFSTLTLEGSVWRVRIRDLRRRLRRFLSVKPISRYPSQVSSARFLNVDLDLRDELGVASVVRALEPGVFVLHEERTFASLELATGTTPPLEEVLDGLICLVEALSHPARALWDRCSHRRMNVGIESGLGLAATGFLIPLTILQRLVAIHAEVELTVYPPEAGAAPQPPPHR